MSRCRMAVAVLLLAAVLSGCRPTGRLFGHGDTVPRPEFPGSPMAPAAQIQEREESNGRRTGGRNF